MNFRCRLVPVIALTLLFAGEPRDGAVEIRADADIYFGKLDAGKQLVHQSAPGRGQRHIAVALVDTVEGSWPGTRSKESANIAAGDRAG